MHICDILQTSSPSISFEFFPAKTESAWHRLEEAIAELSTWQPDFVSVTYGAGGSTRDTTKQLVEDIQRKSSLNPIPHLTCVNHQQDEIDTLLHEYARLGVNNILALRGDPPRDLPHHDHTKDFCVQCADLVRHIQDFNRSGVHPHKRGFGIGVAGFPEGHPGTPNRLLEMDHLKAKVDAGADYICTQLFFDNRDFHDFRERCELAGIRIPILAGILPVTSFTGLRRIAELAGGARVPAPLLRTLSDAQDDPDEVLKIGLEHATQQCLNLIEEGVDGIHFYTLNQASPTAQILEAIGIMPRKIGF